MDKRKSLQQVTTVDATPAEQYQAAYDRKQAEHSVLATERVDALNLFIKSILAIGVSVTLLIAFLVALVGNLFTFLKVSNTIMLLFLHWLVPGVIAAVTVYLLRNGYKAFIDYRQASLEYKRLDAEVNAINDENKRRNDINKAEVKRIEAEAEEIRARAYQMYNTLPLDQFGNVAHFNRYTGQVTVLSAENWSRFPQLSSYHEHNTTGQNKLAELSESTEASQKQIIAGMRIPTFAESMQAGLIGPGQDKVLICYELERNDDNGLLTGNFGPYQDKLENNCTMFLGGSSKSGKSTLMAHLGAQEAMMNALFYVIDPHLSHPEKSVARKLEALSHAFILPPAVTDAEIFAVLEHAENEAMARVDGKETPYSGRPIVVIVDEVLALFARAQRAPDNKEIQALYRRLALFFRDLGTQYNKYDVNGIFATQYLTKDAFKLPKGVDIDFRDACQNQTLLRLPANQAQAMRLIDAKDLRGIRQLPPGHGYMGFVSGDIIRMASGNVTRQDIEMAGQIVEAVPNSKRYTFGTGPVLGTDGLKSGAPTDLGTTKITPVSERDSSSPDTGDLENGVNQPVEPAPMSTTEAPASTKRGKEFTSEQELTFLQSFKETGSIRRSIVDDMHLSYGDYQATASRLVQRIVKRGN